MNDRTSTSAQAVALTELGGRIAPLDRRNTRSRSPTDW